MTRQNSADTSATPSQGAWRSLVGPSGRLPDPLPEDFSARPAREVAPALLGMVIHSQVGGSPTAARIVETEAYIGRHDPACHGAAAAGRTQRNASMFGPPGRAYVYFIYGMHWCLNVVTGEADHPEAVLIRAGEPVLGRDVMARRRGRDRDLTSGPARLCQALGVDGELDGHHLTRAPLQLLPAPPVAAAKVAVSGRIGIRQARDWPLRFFLREHPCVSSGPHLPADADADLTPPGPSHSKQER